MGPTTCSRLCENENEKSTAFYFNNYRVNRSSFMANCTLLTNVTETVLRKVSNHYNDRLLSAKKCKHYDQFNGSMEQGIIVAFL